jgi:hypothetical protein
MGDAKFIMAIRTALSNGLCVFNVIASLQ